MDLFHDSQTVDVLERCGVTQDLLIRDDDGNIMDANGQPGDADADAWGHPFVRLTWPGGDYLEVGPQYDRQAVLDLAMVAHRFDVDADGLWTMLVWGLGG